MKQTNVKEVDESVAKAAGWPISCILAILVLIISGCATAPPKPVVIRNQNPPVAKESPSMIQKDGQQKAGQASEAGDLTLVELLKKKNLISAEEARHLILQDKSGGTKGPDADDHVALIDLLMKKNIVSSEEAALLAKPPDVSAPRNVAAAALEQKKEQKSKNPADIDDEMKKKNPEQVRNNDQKVFSQDVAEKDNEQNEKTQATSGKKTEKDLSETVNNKEQKDVSSEVKENEKQDENTSAGIDKESEGYPDEQAEKEDDSAEQLENAGQKDVPPAMTTRIDDTQVDEIMDGVKEELKSDIHEQVYNQVKEMIGKELAGELKKTDIVPYLPDWMRRLRIFADARLRYQYIFYDKENFNEEYVRSKGEFTDEILNTWADEQSFKYRIRFGLESRNQYFDAAIRLSTGNTTNPISTNATFGDYFNKDTVVVDQAYIKLKPWDFLSIYGGRMPNPWFSTDLVWDADLNFEGLVLAVNKSVTEKITPFVTIGAFPLQQSDVTSLDDTSQHAKWLYAGQIGLKRKDIKGISAQIGLAYYYFSNITGEFNETGIAGATDWSMPPYTQYGNTWFQIDPLNDPAKFGLASEFKEANVTALLDIGFFDPVHIILTGDYVRNFGFNKSDVAARTGDADPGEWIDGYKIGLSVGHTDIRERGKWRAFFNYKYLGKDAVVDAFTDSDFHIWGTDARGWMVGGEIGLFKNVWISSRWTAASNISGPQLLMDTFQADLNVEF